MSFSLAETMCDPSQYAPLARAAEDAGFHAYTLPDSIAYPAVSDSKYPYTPDGSPLIGPAWGKKNFWLAEGFSFGITAAGGAGDLLSDWMVNGEPAIDPADEAERRELRR